MVNELEAKLMKMVWRSRRATTIASMSGTMPSTPTSSYANLAENARHPNRISVIPDKVVIPDRNKPRPPSQSWWSWRLSPSKSEAETDTDVEKASVTAPRPIKLMAPLYGGLGLALSICA